MLIPALFKQKFAKKKKKSILISATDSQVKKN